MDQETEARGCDNHCGAGQEKVPCSGCRQLDAEEEEAAGETIQRLLDKVTEMVLGHKRDIGTELETQLAHALDTETEMALGHTRGIGRELARRRASVTDSVREELEKQHASAIGNAQAGLATRLSSVGDNVREALETASASTLHSSREEQVMPRGSKLAVLVLAWVILRADVTALSTVQAMQFPGSRSTTSSSPNRAYAPEDSHLHSATRLPVVSLVLRRPGSGRLQRHTR